MKKWLLTVDVARCENCNNCFLACKDEHVGNDWPGCAAPQPEHGHKWMNIQSRERGQYPFVDVAYLPVPCQHCADAPCIKAAKDGAVYKRPDGIVIIDPVRAKGQKQLVAACPYGAIWWHEELELPQKCTLCAHLLDSGWEKPRCVQSCPTGALGFRFLEESKLPQLVRDEGLEVYRPELKTGPSVYYKNLYRFSRCFIGGSVAFAADGREECAEGALVTLHNAAGQLIGECRADTYGDFKFDNLAGNSGKYTLKIEYIEYPPKTVEVELKESLYTGVIYL